MRTDDTTLVDSISLREETQCVQVLSEHLVGKARREVNPHRKERLLTFAKVCAPHDEKRMPPLTVFRY